MDRRHDIATLYARTAAALDVSAALAERDAARFERCGQIPLAGREREAAAHAHRAAERALRGARRMLLRQQAEALFARPRCWGLRLREGGMGVAVPPGAELPTLEAAVIGADLGGIVRLWSPGAAALYQWSPGEVLGRPVMEVIMGSGDASVAERIVDSVRSSGSWEGELWGRRRDGTRLLVHARDVLALADDGRPAGIVGVSVELPWEHGTAASTSSSAASPAPARA